MRVIEKLLMLLVKFGNKTEDPVQGELLHPLPPSMVIAADTEQLFPY